jgi:hypothetical protein
MISRDVVAGELFHAGQAVWTWCDGKAATNRIEGLETDGGVPEFFLPSSDRLDARLIRMFPALDRELALRSRPATRPGTDPT